jgi:hypothetical protein
VLFEQRFWAGMADGTITVTFRRWKKRQAIAGRSYRTAAGMIAVTAADVVTVADITDADAIAGGYPSRDALIADLRGTPDLDLYRIRFEPATAPDPRDVLAAASALSAEDIADLETRLGRLDKASKHGPWTRTFLELIDARPAIRAGDLAPIVGRDELQDFKLDVRKLKNLGLTISLGVGYRLSPRGMAYLRHLQAHP